MADRTRLDLRQLELFVAVAEEGHFTKAAQRARVAQSTVSSAIRALERTLGAPLFTRSTRSVALTAAGLALLPEARRVLSAAESARSAVEAITGLRAGRVAIGTGKTLAVDITGRLVRFCTAHPEIDVRLQQSGSLELLEAVAAGTLDFAPLGLVRPLPRHLEDAVVLKPLSEEPVVAVCSPGHRLAQQRTIGLSELADERQADLVRTWAIRIGNDRTFAAFGERRRLHYEMNDVDELLDIVASGLAVALVPRSIRKRSPELHYLAIHPQPAAWTVVVAVQRGTEPSPAARALFTAIFPRVSWPA